MADPRYVALLAVDSSPSAHEVVRRGADFARCIPGAELHLVHVVEDLPPPVSPVPRPMGLGVSTAEILGSARQRLTDLSKEARTLFPGRIGAHLAAGSASKQILQVAIDLQADVILVGTHGRTGIKRMVLGSVAETVARKASCPVLVVREKDYHAFVPPEIEPACPECLRTQGETSGARLTCEAHGEHHPRSHAYFEVPPARAKAASR